MPDLRQARGQQATQPFCSDRCKDLDLHRWLSGAYAIPASSDDEDEDGKPHRRAKRRRSSNGYRTLADRWGTEMPR